MLRWILSKNTTNPTIEGVDPDEAVHDEFLDVEYALLDQQDEHAHVIEYQDLNEEFGLKNYRYI